TWRLAQHVETNTLGVVYAAETGFRLSSDPDTVRAPDAAFVSLERTAQVGKIEGYFAGAPDLAVEVVSPGDSYSEVESKAVEWLEGGARAVVVLNPRKRTVTVYRSFNENVILSDDAVVDLEDIVPGFKIAIRDIFD
ncbi:MAG: Uma2 family endonuclease, partial [Blastocatellia bacterium]